MNEITKELLDALKACLKKGTRWHPADPVVLGAISAIAKAEAALAAPQADADGWIPWSGGECPVHGSAPVAIQTKNGGKHTGPAKIWEWRHLGHFADIAAYRIIKESDK